MEEPAFIYALAEPPTGDVRYIGKSVKPLTRYRNHCKSKSDTRCARWIRKLAIEGLVPVLFVLEGPCRDWEEAEQRWIRFYLGEGANLTNLTDGGEGLSSVQEETRQKMSLARQGKAPWNKGKPALVKPPPLYGAKNHWHGTKGPMGGKSHKPETLTKMRASHLLRYAKQRGSELLPIYYWAPEKPIGRRRPQALGHSQETRDKIGAANAIALRGRKQPVEVVAKRNATMAKRWKDPEFRAAHLAGLRDPVVLAKIAAASRARPVSVCDICEQEIRGGKQNLVVHKKWRHSASPPEQPLLTCDVCGRETCSAAGLASHKRSHSTNRTPSKRRSTRGPSTVVLTCDTCGTQVKGPSAMATHLAFHAMPVTACDVCGQQVKGTGAMTTHMRWKHLVP